MGWQYTPFTAPLALTTLVSLATLGYVLRRANYRLRSRLLTVYVLIAVGVVVWSTAYALQLSSTTLAAKQLWNDVVWLGITLVTITWVLFVFEYVGVKRALEPRWVVLVGAVPVTTLVAAWTNFSHGLLMGTPYLETTAGGVVVFAYDFGPMYAVHLVVTLGLDVLTYVVLAWAWWRASADDRAQYAVLFVVGVVPFLGVVAALTGLWPYRVDPTPILFVVTALVFGWVISRHGILDLVPTARRTVLEDLSDGVVVTDEAGRVLDVNRTAEAILGAGDSSLVGTPLDEIEGRVDGLTGAFDAPGTEVAIRTTVDGEERVFDLRVDTVGSGSVGVFRDRTDARRAQHRFQTIIERTDTLVSVLDEEGTITYASPSYERLLSLDPEAMVGEDALSFVHPEDRAEAMRELFAAQESPGLRDLTVRVRYGEHEWRDVAMIGESLLDDPTIGGVVVWGQDVTEQQRYQQRLRVLNRVLRHDLRNDMNVVGGYAEMLDDDEDPRVAEIAEIIDRKVDDLLDLSEKARAVEESLSNVVTQEAVDLVELVAGQTATLRSAWPEATIALEAPESGRVLAHPLISSAVDNVLENAVEHSDTPTPHVDVTVRRASEDGPVELRVADDGPGIPRFEREVIASGSESSLEHSSGLGLWLVNWVVTQSGGEVDIVVTDDGSVVTIRLPAAPEVAPNVAGTAATSDVVGS